LRVQAWLVATYMVALGSEVLRPHCEHSYVHQSHCEYSQ